MPLVIKGNILNGFKYAHICKSIFLQNFLWVFQISSAISLIFAYETPFEPCVSETDTEKITKSSKMMLFTAQVTDRKKPTFDTWNALYFWKFKNMRSNKSEKNRRKKVALICLKTCLEYSEPIMNLKSTRKVLKTRRTNKPFRNHVFAAFK